jgi:flagellar biosynthetic protein FliR
MSGAAGIGTAVTGAELAVGATTLAGYLVAVARTAGFVLVAPPFNTRVVPARTRAGFALALAMPLTGFTAPVAPALDSTALLLAMVSQLVLGATLGFLVLVAMATVQAVGDIIDAVGGFQMAMGLDPTQMTQTSIMGRLHQLTGLALLFATGGHLVVLHGLSRSIQSMPTPHLDAEQVARAVAGDAANLLAGAVEVAAPVLAVMLVADVSLGLLTRAAPALNAFALGFPLKILFTLMITGLVVARLPDLVQRLVEHAAVTDLELTRAAGGG